MLKTLLPKLKAIDENATSVPYCPNSLFAGTIINTTHVTGVYEGEYSKYLLVIMGTKGYENYKGSKHTIDEIVGFMRPEKLSAPPPPQTVQSSDKMPCCDCNDDVLGMCFARLGDLSQVTLQQIVEIRKCPQLNYSVAWWLFNNFEVSEVRPDAMSFNTFWRKRRDIVQYLGLIIRTPDEQWNLKNAIKAMETDEESDEEQNK
jgi:hypothetical protein